MAVLGLRRRASLSAMSTPSVEYQMLGQEKTSETIVLMVSILFGNDLDYLPRKPKKKNNKKSK